MERSRKNIQELGTGVSRGVEAGAQGSCGQQVWATREKVLDSRLEFAPCSLAMGSHGWPLSGDLVRGTLRRGACKCLKGDPRHGNHWCFFITGGGKEKEQMGGRT